MFSEEDAALARSLACLLAKNNWQEAADLANRYLAADRPIVLERRGCLGHWYGYALAIEDNSLQFQFSNLVASPRIGDLLLRWVMMFPLVAHFLARNPEAAGVLYVNLSDAPERPGLAFSSCRADTELIPDPDFIVTRGYQVLRNHFSSSPVPWASRRPIAYWRGSTTGAPLDYDIGWKTLPRILLCEFASAAPHFFDLGITRVVELDDPEAVRAYLQSKGLFRSHAPQEALQEFKYQIDIDGHTNSWSGLFIKLLSGSPVLKIVSRLGWRQWYYERMKAWENFVPVEMNREDLLEKVRWLREHDETAERIGSAGRALAETMTYEAELAEAATVMRRTLHPASSG